MRGYWLRFADAVVNVSADTHEETIRRGVPSERSMVVYSGLDLSPYRNPLPRSEAKARLGFSGNDVLVGNVARMWGKSAPYSH
jgi:hypothetical protein